MSSITLMTYSESFVISSESRILRIRSFVTVVTVSFQVSMVSTSFNFNTTLFCMLAINSINRFCIIIDTINRYLGAWRKSSSLTLKSITIRSVSINTSNTFVKFSSSRSFIVFSLDTVISCGWSTPFFRFSYTSIFIS